MPLWKLFLQSPIRRWPSLIHFFLWNFFIPNLINRFIYNSPREVRAMEYVIKRTRPGDPEAVLRALDEFGRKEFLMNVGDEKGVILTNAIKKAKPKYVLELGTYLGYSAIDIARNLPAGSKLFSVEVNPLHAALADKLVEWAGLRDKVTIIIGESSKIIPSLKESYNITHVDLVFLDHWKDLYVPDLQLLEQSHLLLRKKTVIVGDNVLFPGAPEYLAYVLEKPEASVEGRDFYYDTQVIKTHLEYNAHIEDLVTISIPI